MAIAAAGTAVGLSTGAYLSAKITVFCAFAIAQAAIATGIVLVGKGAPKQSALLLGNASLELFVTVAATCVASAILGLVLSSIARACTAFRIMDSGTASGWGYSIWSAFAG